MAARGRWRLGMVSPASSTRSRVLQTVGSRARRTFRVRIRLLGRAGCAPGRKPRRLEGAWPDRESEHEANALAAWGGNGAVRLIDYDAERRALLIERCEPGTPLSAENPNLAMEI